jgi:outer membrane protein OmpU
MKKFLIASTALVMTAGAAAAEVKIGGDARFGLQYNGAGWANGSKTALEKRMTVNIDGTTTADNGVTFGARVRIRSDEGARNAAASGTAVAGARVFARAGGLTVAAGNILGAVESMPGLYAPSVGLTGLGWSGLVANVAGLGHAAFDWDAFSSTGNGAEGIEVIYSMGDFTGHLSYSSNDLARTLPAPAGSTKRVGAYGSYKFSGWTVALGLQDSDAAGGIEDKVILTVGGKIGDFGVGFGAAQNGKGANKINKFAINGSYTMGATTISGYVAQQGAAAGVLSRSTYGIGASYAMGGGASLVGGIERTTAKTTRADVGVSFSF